MKKPAFVICFAVVIAVAFYGSGVTAVDRGFAERFAEAVQTGESGVYNFDRPHSVIGFKVKHNGLIYIPGYFRDFTGEINYDAKDVTRSSVNFTAKASSIDTGVTPRDNHLRSADFFEVEKFPEITFKSTKVEKKGKELMLTGDLTMKGVTRSVTFPFSIAGFLPGNQRNGPRMGVMGETKLNRRDYGVNYGGNIPGTNIPVIADDIQITLQIEAVQPKPPAQPAE